MTSLDPAPAEKEHKNPIYFNYIFEGHGHNRFQMGSCGRLLCAGPGEGSEGSEAAVALRPGLTAQLTAQSGPYGP